MIAASEPLEFVPHGRTVLAKHPGQIYGKHNTSASENSLLYKLTNFGIKDESLLVDKDEEKEWWTIREVYYRESDVVEEESPPKDSKYDYNSESFRPPSRLRPDFNISIKSELLNKKPDEAGSAGTSRGGSANSSSNMSKKFNLNSKAGKGCRKKPLNPRTDSFYEEELYVKGCTAVWSKGLISTPATKLSSAEHRETISCYTIENPIKHAVFANFYVDIKNTMLIDALNSQIGDVKKNIKIEDTTEHIKTEIMPSIVLLDNKCMRVYATDGREYITSVPFQVKKVWTMKYGVLLEKDASPAQNNPILPASLLRLNETNNSSFNRTRNNLFNTSGKSRQDSLSAFDSDVPLPTCFSMTHPLDEVTPILMKSPSQGLQYYNDGDVQIIFVNTNPSIILLYDWKIAIHSLWRIRKATREECLLMCPNMNSTTTMFSQSCDYIGSPLQSNKNATSWATGLGSPYQSRKAPSTPTRSRLNSPMANVFHQQGMSPHASIGQASSMSMMANTMSQQLPSLPLYPDICIDHIWTDNMSIRRDPIENTSDTKTFLHTDLVGHEYLCFMVRINSVSKLQILRLQKSHFYGQSSKTNLIVGTVSTVLAKDAVVLPHLKMIALIDEAGNIILQSGNSVVGKVHVGGVLARLLASPYSRRAAFPRRSSLLPSRREDAALDDSALHLLSPVPHASAAHHGGGLGLSGVCDAAGSRLTLQFEAGAMYRISLPALSCSTLVTKCCAALTAILPNDITMQLLIKWYGVRNAPGTQDLTPDQEWTMFSDLLLSSIGYDTERLKSKSNDDLEHTETVSKKQRTSSDGSLEDWEYLLNSKLHKSVGNNLSTLLKLPTLTAENKHKHIHVEDDKPPQFNTNSLLLPYIPQILYAFHLVYEEIKLNTLLWSDLKPLSSFLYQLAKDLKLESYVNHYWLDFPTDLSLEIDTDSQIPADVVKMLNQPSYFSKEPPNVFAYFDAMLRDVDVGYYPYLVDINNTSRDLIEVLSVVGCGRSAGVQTVTRREGVAASTPRARRDSAPPAPPPHCQAVLVLCERGVTSRDIDNLPPALGLFLISIFARCKAVACEWPAPAAAYALVMREELAIQQQIADTVESSTEFIESLALEVLEKETAYSVHSKPTDEPVNKSEESDSATGMEHLNTKLLSLLYPRDHRMTEVFNLLQSSQPVSVNLTQRPEVSDHEFIEEQERYLHALSTRTTALPLARGMLTYRTLPCSPVEQTAVPRVWSRARGRGGGEPAPAPAWPLFHSGAAAGLALVPATGSSLDSTWLLYNKPKGVADLSPEHAGFLLALGLNGHLRDMPFMHMYEYLVKCNEMLSVGLLLGLAATYRGTMDVQATKLMSIHLEPLLPPTSVELDIQQGVLAAALLAVGLLYQGTAHNHYSQVLLNEIGKPPGPEMENCVEREGYALAAGLALGMLQAGEGARAPRNLPHALRTYMRGGDKHPLTGNQKEKYKQGSFAIREGATVNLDVTSPGATVALGLLYLRTGAAAPAAWLRVPDTPYDLDFVRPDLLMLRVIARGLVLWDDIEASDEWIEAQVPDTIKPYVFVKPTEDNIDYEAMNHAYCNIVAGACFALGIRFAGSGCEDARDAALRRARRFLALAGRSLAELAGRTTLEACLCVCLLAAAMIMAGRGDLDVLRVCRRLRARVPPAAAHAPLTHGGQMAVHSAVGLLFLGGGRATLGTSRSAVAALLAAFFPKFPTHSEDNRYHLQAFRHLYVLAVEPRLFLPRDLHTGKLCYAHIQVVDLSGASKEMKAPCIIPELSTLREVKVDDPRYWPITFRRDRNWDQLQRYLEHTWCVEVKQRAGCVSYAADPRGFRTLLARALTLDRAACWAPRPHHLRLFAGGGALGYFIDHYLTEFDACGLLMYSLCVCSRGGDALGYFIDHYLTEESESPTSICAECLVPWSRRRAARTPAPRACSCRARSREERARAADLRALARECALRDVMCALPIWVSYIKIISAMKTEPTSYHMWQIKLLLSQIENHNRRSLDEMTIDNQEQNEPLISNEFVLAIKQKVCYIFDSWELKLSPYLRKYLGLPSSRKLNSCDDTHKRFLSAYVVYHDLQKSVLKECIHEDELSVLMEKESLTSEALSKVESLVR